MIIRYRVWVTKFKHLGVHLLGNSDIGDISDAAENFTDNLITYSLF